MNRKHIIAFLILLFMPSIGLALEIKEVSVIDDAIPAAFNDVRIAFVTDIHHGPYVSREQVRKVVDRVNELKPDVVIFGGDYAYRDARYFAPCFVELQRVRSAMGNFGVFGNHDHWYGIENARAGLAGAGIGSLENRGTWLLRSGQRIRVCGVGDLWCGKPDLKAALADATKNDFVILVSHNPDFTEQITGDKVDIVLSGHTHGGQVAFFGYALFVPSAYGNKYRTGIVGSNPKVIISNGIGMIGFPFRFGAPAQIYLLHLKKGRG